MSSFLEKTAEYLHQKYNDHLGDICIVLPNRRARLFFHKYISIQIQKTIWSPQIYSIEEFVEELSGLQIIDNLTLYLEFYSIHKTIKGEDVESFDEFIKWAQTLLADFNEVDLYLADPDKLYNYLTEAKALKVWNLEQKPLSDYEKDFLKF